MMGIIEYVNEVCRDQPLITAGPTIEVRIDQHAPGNALGVITVTISVRYVACAHMRFSWTKRFDVDAGETVVACEFRDWLEHRLEAVNSINSQMGVVA